MSPELVWMEGHVFKSSVGILAYWYGQNYETVDISIILIVGWRKTVDKSTNSQSRYLESTIAIPEEKTLVAGDIGSTVRKCSTM